MNRFFLKFVLVCSVLLLSACTVVPGSHISLDAPQQGASDSVEWLSKVSVQAITPRLIADLRAQAFDLPVNHSDLDHLRRNYDYVVNAGDVLNVTVWDHPELTIPAGGERSAQESGNWVHSDGTIFYPYIGVVKVAGLKVTEIRDIIRERLSAFIQSPQVDVTVAAFRSKKVYITGEVSQPGAQSLTNVPLTLIEAVTQAGGLTERADWTDVTLTRNGKSIRYSLQNLYQHGNLSMNVLLRSGDVVHVARNDSAKIFVLGEVVKPRTLTIGRAEPTLAEVLTESGGFSQATADASGVFVLRQAKPGTGDLVEVYQLNARDATALVLADQFQLQKRDIVYVTAAPIARWNRIIAQLLPTAQAVYLFGQAEGELTGDL